jgi:cytoskeletal protein RodZ
MSEDEAKPIEAETSAPKSAPAPKKKGGASRIFAWLLVLIVLAGIGGLGYLYAIQHPERLQALIHRFTPQPAPSTPPSAPASAPAEPAPVPAAPAPQVAQTAPATSPAPTGADAASTQELMATMQRLQEQLQQVEADNTQMRKALAQQQRMDLNSRLRLIADPATGLKQLSLLWQDVSLSPVLSDSQREQAVSMAAAANQALTQNALWLQHLDRFIAETGQPESGPDLIPHFSHPWLAWLAGQFHLRPATGNTDKGSVILHAHLVRIRNGMAIESWPSAHDWQPVHAELVLLASAAQKPGTKAPAALGLPDDFKTMRQAVANLHAMARQWLETAP